MILIMYIDWNEESFQKYIESSHPGLISSKASLELLWRCFHFYAFYPFPRDATNGMIDYNAFQRAVTLLSARGADLLGFVDGEDWHWLCDNSYITRTNFQRIIRSIGFTHSIGREGLQKGTEENSIVNETMDVLKMTAPFQMHCGPWKDQLEPVVRRILGESASSRSEVPWGQLSELLSLVLRVRLLPTRRTLGIHFGEFEDPGPANETAMRIVNALREDITEDDIASKHYVRLIEVLVYLRSSRIQAQLTFDSRICTFNSISSGQSCFNRPRKSPVKSQRKKASENRWTFV
jgi:hypothetical protein